MQQKPGAPRRKTIRRAILLWIGSLLVAVIAVVIAWDLDAALIQSRSYFLVNIQSLVYDQGMTRFAQSDAAQRLGLPVVVCPVADYTREEFNEPRTDVLPELKGKAIRYREHSRAFHTRVLRNLRRLGARVVVFDMVFDEQVKDLDPLFLDAIRRHGKVVLGALNVQRALAGGAAEQTIKLQFPDPDLREAAAATGFVDLRRDADGAVRRFRWAFRTIDPDTAEDASLPALGVAAAALFTGVDPSKALDEEFGRRGTFLGRPVWSLEERLGPTDVFRVSYIRFFGQTGAPMGPHSVVPYEQVYHAFDPETAPEDLERLKQEIAGKIILIGDETDLGQDTHKSPVWSRSSNIGDTEQMFGVEIQAAVAGTALSGLYVRQADEMVRFLLVVGVSLAIGMTGRLLNPVPYLVLTVVALVGLIGGSIALLAGQGIWLEPITASMGLLTAFGFESTLMFFGERKERIRMRRQLSRQVGPGVAEQLAEHEWPDLSGENREITLLFSDLQGFTSFSEKMSSPEICQLLNRYFAIVFPIVFKYDGTVDKLMGDGMMVYFGWPHNHPDHAARAVRCAMEMQEKLEAWQQTPEMQGKPRLTTRVGIHTGVATVGEIGYAGRAEFTVIGDVVNVASRLEGMNKDYGTTLMISEATREQAGDIARMEFRGEATVRGRHEPMPVYSVEVPGVPPPPPKAPPSPAGASSSH